jgi:hypothetical protein
MKKFIGLLVVVSLSAFATEPSPTAKVSKLMSYAEYGGGDLVFVLETNGSICKSGYYLKKTDPGFEAGLSMLLSAYHAKTPIRVDGHTDQRWAGSSGYFCHVYDIGLGY